MKKVIFTICDKANEWMLPYLKNSLRKFHTEEELPLIVYNQEELDKNLDPHKFYRATPYYAKELIKDYDLVIKMDVDQIVMGSLEHIWNDEEFDVGVVFNWNRSDPLIYGEIGLLTIAPQEYFNCGLVAMRSEAFISHWWELCNSKHFYSMPMREQGFLNILCHYGNYNVKRLDEWDSVERVNQWFGLLNKSETMRMELRDGRVFIPRDDYYNRKEVEVKVFHWAGGASEKKMNYHTKFKEDMIAHIDYLIKDIND